MQRRISLFLDQQCHYIRDKSLRFANIPKQQLLLIHRLAITMFSVDGKPIAFWTFDRHDNRIKCHGAYIELSFVALLHIA